MNQLSYGSLKSLRKGKHNLFTSRKSSAAYFSTSTVEKLASHLESCPDTKSLKKLQACVIKRGLNSHAKFDLSTESKRVSYDDPSSWNPIIVGYFKADQYDEALATYLNLRLKNIGIHGLPITFALKSVAELGAHDFGRNLHTDAVKFGLSCNPFVGSSLIKFYARCDQIVDAAKVFDEITEKDLVVYTSMVTAYAQVRGRQNQTYKAFRVACNMQNDGFDPNRVTLVSLLQCASRLGAVKEGKCIHGFAVRKEIGFRDEVFETSLLDMYIKCGYLESGAMIFNMMSKKSTGSYNALITGHLQTGRPLEAFKLFCRMVKKRELELDLIALANGLLSCADLCDLLTGKSIHCHMVRKGVHLDLVCSTALIDMYSKCKHSSAAVNIFNMTENKDDALFNVMIAGYIRNGSISRAIEIFCEMVINENEHVRPNVSTIIYVLSSLSGKEALRSCKSIHGYVFRQGFETNTDIGNQFISTYARCGFMGYARQVFDKMQFRDRVSWTSMMTGLSNHGLAENAITLFLKMQNENTRPDCVTFTILLQALDKLGFLTLVKEVHGRMYRLFQEKDTTMVKNSLITIYSKWGKFETARDLFEQTGQRDLSTWNTMISAYGMHGDIARALKLITQMEKDDLAPDGVTFKSILSACSHAGFVEEGLRVFKSMEKKYGLVPSDEHYGCVVDLLGRAGRLEEAYDILQRAPSRRNVSTVGALLAACRVHDDLEMGGRVGKWLLDVGPENTSAYCSLSNMYAGEGRWDEVTRIGNVAKGKGLKRITGFSRVDLN
ncbi:pentatricopeptide repeat-containing protein [Striga asiatica]|uniref:Pentatricopeptide repeat-containing protein n=1 Tax=Striga asiatica TaxID=4170 RepID=A0A5A7QL59_STRAF|nr:pentatricopeptide repeat-containing protein [Striga asiatica]